MWDFLSCKVGDPDHKIINKTTTLYRGNILPVSEILTRRFKSEKKNLIIKKIKMRRFIKRFYQSRAE